MATENNVDIKVAVSVEGAPEIDKLGQSLATTGEAAPAIDKLGSSLATTAEAAGTLGDKGAESAEGLGKTTDTSGELSEAVNGMSEKIDTASTALLSLVGIQFGADGVKQIVEIADAYKNLESRIQLVTGEGANFESAFEGITAVALRTNSNLVTTGDLFAKIAEAGKQMGIGQDAALSLTETINQAVQLSGASAEASSAAITQLIQGLQSGVLRGDEFNSIMEQAPRLSTAFADGLGVSTGELRKMAEQGVLTSSTIIKALKGQSDTVAAEFDKLPPTVGRAMTNLSTQFMMFVGATDKAGGYTQQLTTYTGKLAGVIDGLASNLTAVATVMIHVGEAMGAMKLLTMAQSWLAINAATAASSAALTSNTVSTEVNTVAKVANNAATLAGASAATAAAVATAKSAATHDAMGMAITRQTPALTGNAKALTEMGAGLGGAATGAARVKVGFEQAAPAASLFSKAAGTASAAVGLLKSVLLPLLVLDVALHFKQYGTAIGEFAARVMQSKDSIAELEAADKAWAQTAKERAEALARQTAAIKEAADASFGLTIAASATITEFDKLTAAGDSSAEALKKIGKDFDLSSIPGIKNAASVLDKLAADSKISATEFEQAWADALKGQDLATFEVKFRAAMQQAKADADAAAAAWQDAIARGLNGAELKKFEDAARQAMTATGRDAERLAQVLDASLRESIKRSGLDFDLISDGMSKASVSALNDTEVIIKGLDRLESKGVDTALALSASIGKGIDTADSQKAIEAVIAQIELMRTKLGDKIADGLIDQAITKSNQLRDTLEDAIPGVTSLYEGMRKLGVISKETLDTTAGTSKEAYQAMRDSGEATLRELADGFVKYAQAAIAANGGVASAALKVEASMAKVSITTDETGKVIVKSMVGAENAIAAVADAYHQLGIKTPEELNKIAGANAAAWDKVKNDSKLSVADLQKAFTAYAQSAIDANGGVASEALKAEAAMAKISITTDETGKTIVKAMGTGGEAIKGATGYMDAFQRAAKEATSALEKQNAELEHTLSVEEKALDLKERAIDLQNRKNNVDRQGFTLDKDGNRMVVSNETDRSVYEKAKGQGLSEAQALQIMNEFIKNGQQTGWNGQGAKEGKNWYTALQEAIDKIVLENARKASEKEASAKSSQPPANIPAGTSKSDNASSSTAASAQNHTYTVNIPNYGTVNVASANDASSLTSIIDQLARAKASAGV